MEPPSRPVRRQDPRLVPPKPIPDEQARAFAELAKAAEILYPKDVDEPILAPTVAGAVYEWLLELNHSAELAAAGVEPRRMALLYGPPGTGKTTLAHHIAARRGVPLVVAKSEQLTSAYAGESQKIIASFFDCLRPVESACVVLFDEFDGLARARGKSEGGGTGAWHDGILTALLQRIERFRGIGLAATNAPAMMDSAMWRRFGLQISVDLPGEEERFAILRKYALPFDLEDESIDHLVTATRGCSPALLRSLMEGMKRLLILAPKLGLDVSKPEAVFAQVAASISPPPEMERPPLWGDPIMALAGLAGITWPPRRIN
ncbi:MAG: ATP-binding protein [Vicinamibacteria bacterium]|nr:ATP-binding protein [Vicinamibacteria bacterium]